jgi:hypothetical protein
MRRAKCHSCREDGTPGLRIVRTASRHTGGNYRVAGRHRPVNVCRPCAERTLANANSGAHSADRWSVLSLRAVVDDFRRDEATHGPAIDTCSECQDRGGPGSRQTKPVTIVWLNIAPHSDSVGQPRRHASQACAGCLDSILAGINTDGLDWDLDSVRSALALLQNV